MNPLFSIFIPSWNNLSYLKKCVESIRKNSTYEHQIIIHVNEGKDGTLEWVQENGLDYTYTEKNCGVCLAMNMMRTKVKTDYICFINDDMYVLPGWDEALHQEIQQLDSKLFFLSSSVIQPHTPNEGSIVSNYGDSLESFQEERLLKEYREIPINDWQGATVPPNIVHRDLWDLVGGYSIEFSPGMGSDPDFAAKLYLVGVEYFKGVSASRVYHFEQKSTQRLRKNNYLPQFLLKWGIPNSTVRKKLNRRGEDWSLHHGATDQKGIQSGIFRGYFKAIWYVLKHQYGCFRHIWQKDDCYHLFKDL